MANQKSTDYRGHKRKFKDYGGRVYEVIDQTHTSGTVPIAAGDETVVLKQSGRPSPAYPLYLTFTVRVMVDISAPYDGAAPKIV